jgi:hypothetical protein
MHNASPASRSPLLRRHSCSCLPSTSNLECPALPPRRFSKPSVPPLSPCHLEVSPRLSRSCTCPPRPLARSRMLLLFHLKSTFPALLAAPSSFHSVTVAVLRSFPPRLPPPGVFPPITLRLRAIIATYHHVTHGSQADVQVSPAFPIAPRYVPLVTPLDTRAYVYVCVRGGGSGSLLARGAEVWAGN